MWLFFFRKYLWNCFLVLSGFGWKKKLILVERFQHGKHDISKIIFLWCDGGSFVSSLRWSFLCRFSSRCRCSLVSQGCSSDWVSAVLKRLFYFSELCSSQSHLTSGRFLFLCFISVWDKSADLLVSLRLAAHRSLWRILSVCQALLQTLNSSKHEHKSSKLLPFL